jgi:hypothetical protein
MDYYFVIPGRSCEMFMAIFLKRHAADKNLATSQKLLSCDGWAVTAGKQKLKFSQLPYGSAK